MFEGLAKGGTYAVGTNGCIETKTDRRYFQNGLDKMVEVLQPDTVINYCGKQDDIFGIYERQGIEIIPMSFDVMKIFQDAGFTLKELIIKEQHNCKATGHWKTNSIK